MTGIINLRIRKRFAFENICEARKHGTIHGSFKTDSFQSTTRWSNTLEVCTKKCSYHLNANRHISVSKVKESDFQRLPGASSKVISQLIRLMAFVCFSSRGYIARFSMLQCQSQLFVMVGSSHPTFWMSGRSGVCQLVYLILEMCDGAPKVDVADTTGAMAAFRLLTNMGSKQATLAAKNAWIQWRTAKRLENSSSWNQKEKNDNVFWKKKISSSLKQEWNQTPRMKVLLKAYRGQNNQTGNHINMLYFYPLPSSKFFCDVSKVS